MQELYSKINAMFPAPSVPRLSGPSGAANVRQWDEYFKAVERSKEKHKELVGAIVDVLIEAGQRRLEARR